MSYERIIAKIKTINGDIDGIRQALDYEPLSPVCPCLYVMHGDGTLEQQASAEHSIYNILMRLLLRYTDVETTEQDATKFIDKIKTRYRSAVKLDGLLSNGYARITHHRAAYVNISGVVYRLVEFTLNVSETEAVTYGE